MRRKELCMHIKYIDDRKCFICGVTQTIRWRRHPESGNYLCNACGCKQRKEVAKKGKP
uniref:GATA-type domain-containing protein n=1 Tax=Meloidogyne incognita TaxID=6306 RepID=A0A914N6J3_MELIC